MAAKGYGYAFTEACRSKGRGDREAIAGVAACLLEAGVAGAMRLRTGSETSIRAVAQEVAALRSPATTIVETTSRASSYSLGSAERMVQTVAGQVCALKLVVERRWKCRVTTASVVFPWAVRHATWLHNRYQRVRGTTPYASLYGHEYRGMIYEFTEPVYARVSALTDVGKLDPRWQPGIWLGKMPGTGEHIVATEEKLMLARSVKKMPGNEITLDMYVREVHEVDTWAHGGAGR